MKIRVTSNEGEDKEAGAPRRPGRTVQAEKSEEKESKKCLNRWETLGEEKEF